MATNPSSAPQQPAVQRQIKLPLAKAVEIAYKNIRMRLSRSLLVTSGIVLALAFLMAIQTGEAVTDGMCDWIAASKKVEFLPANSTEPLSPLEQKLKRQFEDRRAERDKLKRNVKKLDYALRIASANPMPLKEGQKLIVPRSELGKELTDIQKELATPLPGLQDGLVKAMSSDPDVLTAMKLWIANRKRQKEVDQELNSARLLEADMRANGMRTEPRNAGKVAPATQPTTAPADAPPTKGSGEQTTWLLGLALLVAFVGILNAMLMSVTERFREIGTMKCLGALDTFIVKLFLIESLFQGIIGTGLGIIAGMALSMAGATSTYGGHAWTNLPWSSILTSAGLCFLVGVALTVAGAVYPAWQAARMQPVEAMRVET